MKQNYFSPNLDFLKNLTLSKTKQFLFIIVFGFSINLTSAQVIIPSANTNGGSENDPFGTFYGFERTALIYTNAEIGTTGNITNIGFYLNAVNSPKDAVNVRIYMKTRTDRFITETTYATETTGATLVYGPTTISAADFTAGTWTNVALATAFNYTGDNLEIIIETNATGNGNGDGSTGKQFRYSTQPNNEYSQKWNADNTAPSIVGTRSNNRPNINLKFSTPCSATPIAGTVTVSPASSSPGSTYVVSATGFTIASGLTYQWQNSSNSGPWTNQGIASGTYSNITATAPSLGTTVIWRLIATCTSSFLSGTSTNGSFASLSTLNVPATGNNSLNCGTNVTLYDSGGASGDYVNNSNGHTILNAGLGATVNISGNYTIESYDKIRIYKGSGIGGTLLASYSDTGSINYTGTPGQTLTIQFYSDNSIVYSGFSLSISYSGVCNPSACTGTPTGGAVSTSPNTSWPGSPYTVIATGYSQALNLTFQWQSSTNGGVWTNAGTATSTYSNYNAIAPASGNVKWQLITTCTNSNQIATSSKGIFTTMSVSDVVTGCPNVVSGGLGLNGADPATITCISTSGCVDLEATYLNLGETSSYTVEPIVYNPPAAFNGLTNRVSVNTDDIWSPIVNLPFDFCFYGNTYKKCLIGSNGVITFDTTINNLPGGTCSWSIQGAAAANLPVSGHDALVENSIFGVFHDMNPATLGEVGWQLITLPSGCRALVVSWSNVPMFLSDSANDYTGMMVLYENSNIIEVYIKKKRITTHAGTGTEPMWNDGNAVIGIQNANGTLASVPPGRNVLDPNWTATNEAWRFVPNGTSIASIKWYEGSGINGPVVGTTDVINVCPTATTIYTAEIVYTLCDGRTIRELDQTTVTVNKDKTWNGSSGTDWNTASNWTPSGIPTALQAVYIPDVTNNPTVGAGANALACSLNIETGGVLTINPDKNIIVTNAVTIATGGTFKIKNSASLIQINNIANTGIMQMERTANIRKLDYVYWSSPTTTASTFSSGAISPGTPAGYVYKWTPTILSNVNGFGNWTSGIENMLSGKGYIVRGPNTFTNSLTPFTATFTGTPANGIINTSIQRGTYDGINYNTIVSSTPGTKNDDNWNLIGNPYPSAIKAIDFLTLNTNIEGFINIWTHGTLPSTAIIDPFYNNYVYNYTSSDYITYNASGASTGPATYNGYIPAGQGFFVLMKHSAASPSNVTFNNSMRNTTYTNSQFFKTINDNENTNGGRIWLDIIATNGANVRSLIAYAAGATNENDRLFDAFTDDKLSLNLYSKIEDEIMKIQGRALPFDPSDKVPIGFKVSEDGNYLIAIGSVDGLFSNNSQNIFLEDTQTNIIHNLRQNPYSFSTVSGNHPNRFILRYTNETLAVEDFNTNEATVLVISANELSVKSTKNEIKSVRVYDILGRELANYANVNGYEIPLTKIQKNNSGLIIQVTLTNGAVISKKTIY